MGIYILSSIGLVTIIGVMSFIYRNSKVATFDNNYILNYNVFYFVGNIYQIKISGKIIPNSDDGKRVLNLYDKNLQMDFFNETVKGIIKDDSFHVEMIRRRDKKAALNLMKRTFMLNINETMKQISKEYRIENKLKKLAVIEEEKIKKIACSKCKNRLQCQITFHDCRYEEDNIDPILKKFFAK